MTDSRPIRILYIEDNAGLARLFQKHLERAGYLVDLADDGDEGLAMYDAGAYDVVAVDYKLPLYDGLEVIRRLVRRGPLPPTIMLTGNGDEAIAVEAMKLGAGDYIVKDIERGYLRLLPAVIERLLGQRRRDQERRRAVEALRQSEERFRAVAESASDAIICFDSQGTIFLWNQSAETIFGYSAAEATGRSFTFLIPERLRQTYQDRVNEASLAGPSEAAQKPVELIGVRKGGSEFPAEVSFSVWKMGDKPCHTSIIRDISERKQTETALQAAARLEATATLAGGIAHQFNNLMVGVLGNAELLQMTLADRPDAMRKLDQICRSAQRAGELAQQILAFARGGKYQPTVMNLNNTIRETLKLQQGAFSSKVQLECQLDPELLNVRADPTQMTQLVMNLCLNAVEAIDGCGRVAVATRNIRVDEHSAWRHPDLKPGRYVCLSVEDTGCGMSAEVRSRIFEPFFSTKFTGRGLGLAAVYGIVRNHDGHIAVSSREGQGSTFTVYLPASESEIQRPGRAESVIAEGSETILVVDDEDVVLSVTQQFLKRLGYRVLIARNGHEAAEIARGFDGHIDLTLLDMSMPVMSGPEAFPLLVEAQPGMKVILCSGYELDTAAQALLHAGASAFITKPFGLDVLVSEIRKALDEERNQ